MYQSACIFASGSMQAGVTGAREGGATHAVTFILWTW